MTRFIPPKKQVKELGYKVIIAHNGAEGLEQFKLNQDHIAAVITDVVMPKMSGVEMFRQIRRTHLAIPTIFITGYDQGNVQLLAGEEPHTMVISKPVQIPELSHLIQQLLNA